MVAAPDKISVLMRLPAGTDNPRLLQSMNLLLSARLTMSVNQRITFRESLCLTSSSGSRFKGVVEGRNQPYGEHAGAGGTPQVYRLRGQAWFSQMSQVSEKHSTTSVSSSDAMLS